MALISPGSPGSDPDGISTESLPHQIPTFIVSDLPIGPGQLVGPVNRFSPLEIVPFWLPPIHLFPYPGIPAWLEEYHAAAHAELRASGPYHHDNYFGSLRFQHYPLLLSSEGVYSHFNPESTLEVADFSFGFFGHYQSTSVFTSGQGDNWTATAIQARNNLSANLSSYIMVEAVPSTGDVSLLT
jgi:hypothetical protein